MNDILIGLLGAAATVIAALVAGIITIMRSNKPAKNPSDPDSAQSGQMAVTYWLRELDRMHKKLDRIIELVERSRS